MADQRFPPTCAFLHTKRARPVRAGGSSGSSQRPRNILTSLYPDKPHTAPCLTRIFTPRNPALPTTGCLLEFTKHPSNFNRTYQPPLSKMRSAPPHPGASDPCPETPRTPNNRLRAKLEEDLIEEETERRLVLLIEERVAAVMSSDAVQRELSTRLERERRAIEQQVRSFDLISGGSA